MNSNNNNNDDYISDDMHQELFSSNSNSEGKYLLA